MKISETSIEFLKEAICGNNSVFPYMRGKDLVKFFNRFGFEDNYDKGFPSRPDYVEQKLQELNESIELSNLLEEILDPRRFIIENKDLEKAIKKVNEILKFDGYKFQKVGDLYKIQSREGQALVQSITSKSIDNQFIEEQIKKCNYKIESGDFNGAITNSRSLIEAVFIEIIEREEGREFKNDGNVENLWSKVKKIMKLRIDRETMPDFVVQILSGIDTSIKGLAGLSNNAGDRHANKFNTKKHHAKLAVNIAVTFSDFLLESWEYQQNKK